MTTSPFKKAFEDRGESYENVSDDTALAIRDAVNSVANIMQQRPDIDKSNYITCVAISLLSTVAVNEELGPKAAKQFMKEVKRAYMDSLARYHSGDLESVTVEQADH